MHHHQLHEAEVLNKSFKCFLLLAAAAAAFVVRQKVRSIFI
jgi:hypothetical protein